MSWLAIILALLPIILQLLQLFINRRKLGAAGRARLRGIVAQVRGYKAADALEEGQLAEAKALADELEELLGKAEKGE